ncbi:MAG TPA: VOC family protein [Candidatus Micrarchaeia archaeon]|nr:VOC family protein [Candidatus Micrarchaeia archaeon]
MTRPSHPPGSVLAIDHVGLAVADLDAAIARHTLWLGHGPVAREAVEPDGIVAVLFEVADARVELLASRRPDSTVARFLERRGEGLHHLAYRVEDVSLSLRAWEAWGATLIDRQPRPGAGDRLVGFVHPRGAGGVLVELCQELPGAGR